jgi:hypothetical protein
MPIQVTLPSGRVTTINTDDPKVAAATARAFVMKDPYESTMAQVRKQPGLGTAAGETQTMVRGIPFLSEAQALIPTLAGMGEDALKGKPASFSKSWTAARARQQALVDSYSDDHPVGSSLVKGTAMAAPIAAAILSGGATAAPAVAADAPAAANGISGFLKTAVRQAPKAAVTAGAGGAVYGAAQPGDLGERLQGADTGAAVGATIGTLAPPLAAGGAKAVGNATLKAATTVARAANRLSGGALSDPAQTAVQRLTMALKADGATPDLLRTALNGYLKNGATDPSLIDVATRLPSGGENTMALVRAAASKGSGRGVAKVYSGDVAANLQDKAIDATRALTPDTRAANVVRDKAVDSRASAATTEYGAPYSQVVDAAPVISALDGDAGRVGIGGAYKDADALRLGDQQAELAKLRAAAGPVEVPEARIAGDTLPPSPQLAAALKAAGVGQTDDTIPVSLGTLDRVKIALNDAGQGAARAGNNSQAAGFFQRAAEIDDHLASQSDDYAGARDNFARRSAAIDALDHGATGLMAHPDEYEAALSDLRTRAADPNAPDADPAGDMAGVGYRQALTDAIGAPTEGATGALNKVSTSTNQGRNLETTFGTEGAKAYRDGLKDLVDQLSNARSIDPNTNSASAMRLTDMGLVDPDALKIEKPTIVGTVLGVINKVRAGATLTDAEREMIARIGTMKPDIGSLDLSDPVNIGAAPASRIPLAPLTIGVRAGEDQDPRSQ